jgi:hypothetical protein
MSHTSGDWEFLDDGRIVCGSHDLDHTIHAPGITAAEIRANGHLIASAPDLLAALVNIVEQYTPTSDTVLLEAERAIEKARGMS